MVYSDGMASYVGIDAGGSGSRWVLLEASGSVTESADGPAIQVAEFGPEARNRYAAGMPGRLEQQFTNRARGSDNAAGAGAVRGGSIRGGTP
jgi:N-acetylglucosamine kinase-like BadF-type ATPase